MVAVLTPLQEVVNELSQDGNILRIKKLLVYACRRTWENDPERLNRFHLAELIRDLLGIVPTLGQLRTYLSNIVKTLNKPDEYTLVANAIVNRLLRLYPEDSSGTSVSHNQQYLQLAADLEQHNQHLRLKKLIFCACKQTWENDPTVLSQYSLVNLVQELHQLTPTPQGLEAILYSIVRTLNRSNEYMAIADTITAAFAPLYVATPEAPIDPAVPPQLTPAIPATPDSKFAQVAGAPAVAVDEPGMLVRSLVSAELFELRLYLMKYTNPFQAKMLLYAVLHCPLPLPELGIELRQYDLDELLRNLMRDYKLFPQLEQKCLAIARVLPNAQSALQSAQVVLRLVKPFYSQPLTLDEKGYQTTSSEVATELETGRMKRAEPTRIHSVQSQVAIASNLQPEANRVKEETLAFEG